MPFPLAHPRCVVYSNARSGLRDGLEALGVGAGTRMLLPAWHHGSEVEAVRRTGAECTFYDLDEDLAPRPEVLESLLSPDVVGLHLTHFLGFPQDASRWRRWCDRRGLLLVEDAAQAWLASRDGVPVGSHGDLAVWCLYKTVGVPDGAAVLCARELPGLPPGGLGASGVARRQAAWLSQLVPGPAGPTEVAYDALDDMALTRSAAATGATSWLWPRLVSTAVADRRRANYARWEELLAPVALLRSARVAPGAVPMVFPVVVEDKPAALAALRAVGVRALDLWRVPHPSAAGADWPRAAWLRDHVVGLPVHQELRQRRLAAAVADVAALLLDEADRPGRGR